MRVLFCLCLSLLISACAFRSEPANYYLLSPTAAAASHAVAPFQLQPIDLADYLRRSSLVIRDGNQVLITDADLWAGTLEDEIGRVMIANLNRLAGTAQAQPAGSGLDTRLQLRIDRFDGALNGEVRLQGTYSIQVGSGAPSIYRQFSISQPAGGTRPTLVDAHNAALAALAGLIITDMPRP